MQVITDEKLIRNRARLGRVASFAGLAVLILGLVASLYPQWLLASFGCLFVGFLLSQVGIYHANRWVKQPRADQTLEKILKGFDDRYHLYNYVLPAPHVLLTPFGLCVIKPRHQGGKIRYQGGKWHHELGWRWILRFFGQEGLGNPSREVQSEVEKLSRFLAQRLSDDNVPVEGVVVFTNPEVDLQIETPPVPVLDGRQFKLFLRDLSGKRPISDSQRKDLAASFPS
ncbi:MAG: NERD domain-containing protein [Chloroflexi bacterium]|nr:NERD domain-containing protein [Chloroflexota bacterium]